MEGLYLTVPGFPARFCNSYAALDTVCTHTFGLGTTGLAAVVTGIDVWSGPTAGSADGWYSVNESERKVVFASWVTDITHPLATFYGSWRGAMALSGTDSMEFGVETLTPARMTVTAWGFWIPHDIPAVYAAP